MPQYKPLPPLEELREVFSVVPVERLGHDSGLVYKVDYRKYKKGQVAGRLYFKKRKTKKGIVTREDWKVCFRGSSYFVSRVIYYLAHSVDPGDLVVDHKDGEPRNNNVSNLQRVTQHVNSHRAGPSLYSKTGAQGIRRNKIIPFLWEATLSDKGVFYRSPAVTCPRIAAHLYNNSVLKHVPFAVDRKLNILSDVICLCGVCPFEGEEIQRSFMDGDCVEVLNETKCLCDKCDPRFSNRLWLYQEKVKETRAMIKAIPWLNP